MARVLAAADAALDARERAKGADRPDLDRAVHGAGIALIRESAVAYVALLDSLFDSLNQATGPILDFVRVLAAVQVLTAMHPLPGGVRKLYADRLGDRNLAMLAGFGRWANGQPMGLADCWRDHPGTTDFRELLAPIETMRSRLAVEIVRADGGKRFMRAG
jgi:hypothetical protein